MRNKSVDGVWKGFWEQTPYPPIANNIPKIVSLMEALGL